MRQVRHEVDGVIFWALLLLVGFMAWTSVSRMTHVWFGPQPGVVAAVPQKPSLFIGRTPGEAELEHRVAATQSTSADRFDKEVVVVGADLQRSANGALRRGLISLFSNWISALRAGSSGPSS